MNLILPSTTDLKNPIFPGTHSLTQILLKKGNNVSFMLEMEVDKDAMLIEAMMWAGQVSGLDIYIFAKTDQELDEDYISPYLRFARRSIPWVNGPVPYFDRYYTPLYKRVTYRNGSRIRFCRCANDNDAHQYAEAEINLLIMKDPLEFTEFQYAYLCKRVRLSGDVGKGQDRLPGIVVAAPNGLPVFAPENHHGDPPSPPNFLSKIENRYHEIWE
jgi:hypothetical protein